MRYAVLDVESTIYQKGHPFAERNKLCLVGIRVDGVNHIFDIEYSDEPYGEKLVLIQELLDSIDLVVGFNSKFDLNWLSRYGIFLANHVRVFDCQLAEFILNHQSTPFPSLDDCCAKYGLGGKLDVVNRDYWSVGIDTPQVPMEILGPYLEKDLELTDALYLQYKERLSTVDRRWTPLISLQCQDLRVLQEMESNGIFLDWANMAAAGSAIEKELDEINKAIISYAPEDSRGVFNTGSNDHVSLLLYGGTLVTKQASPYLHEYKSGPKAGTSEIRNKWADISIQFPRLVDPLPKSALAKRGPNGEEIFWSTGADVLKELSGPKKLLKLLLKQAELAKLLTTYYQGLVKKAEKMDWKDGFLHGQFNQCQVVTGRLSSSNPNLQNLPEVMNEFIQSRYI